MRSALLIIGFLLTIGVGSAAATPTSGQLSFTWRPSGSLELEHRLNRSAKKKHRCIVRVRAAISGENQQRRDEADSVLSKRVRGRVLRLRANKLPGVGSFTTGDAVLTLQAKTTCSKSEFVSNAVARFVKCGANLPRVSGRVFLEALQTRIR